ncbi:DUF1738 domain-containing protein [Coleofasciculus sp. LEGE 07081]|uniref:ArdC family protein n=1 Tax=Coleofasciculus sp. LEGE 07081 TaxID=2777967 RepID=UPI0018818E5E|nr:zincin-like metallopeptidase domain-containing protein [Coleofasciculus sp. LEGE 07081]MBE9128320.1 DUF1738 domain-containing protein [Coleofasciculus sp. LEGE 07081]
MNHVHATVNGRQSTSAALKGHYSEITNRIVQAIESGATMADMPWHQVGNPIPSNVESGKQYRGINILSLWASSLKQGFSSGIWGTYKQWADLGCQVRKGERASPVVFWDSYTDDQSDSETTVQRTFCKRFSVFNSLQVEGYDPAPALELNQNHQIVAAEAFFLNIGADLRVGGDVAGYSKSGDFIRVPELKQFKRSEGYYSTIAHEHIHWSGHESRLSRDLSGRFGDASYAMEELIAELGAAFLCSDIGVTTSPRDDHAGYISSWLRVLKNDHRAIFYAASAAQKAVDYLKSVCEEDPVLVGSALVMATKKVFDISE